MGRASAGRGSWVVSRESWVVSRGSWVVSRGSWVVGRGSYLFEVEKRYKYILAPSVLGPNLQLPAHELISPTPFMKR